MKNKRIHPMIFFIIGCFLTVIVCVVVLLKIANIYYSKPFNEICEINGNFKYDSGYLISDNYAFKYNEKDGTVTGSEKFEIPLGQFGDFNDTFSYFLIGEKILPYDNYDRMLSKNDRPGYFTHKYNDSIIKYNKSDMSYKHEGAANITDISSQGKYILFDKVNIFNTKNEETDTLPIPDYEYIRFLNDRYLCYSDNENIYIYDCEEKSNLLVQSLEKDDVFFDNKYILRNNENGITAISVFKSVSNTFEGVDAADVIAISQDMSYIATKNCFYNSNGKMLMYSNISSKSINSVVFILDNIVLINYTDKSVIYKLIF